jgi:hypothetical protein
MQFRALADQAAADGAITADEILSLRRAAWPDGRIDHDGRLDSMAELELLVRVLEKAANAPEALKTYAQVQIERAVVFGTGPTRDGGTLDAGCISTNECKLLRRLIFAAGGDGPANVSRAEAEMLFRIKDATLDADNAPDWERLFVQGVGNHLQAWHGKGQLSRERAAELEIFMNDRTSHLGHFFSRMGQVGTGALGSTTRTLLGRKLASGAGHDAEIKEAEAVTDGETLWLSARIDADGKLDPLEKALLEFLRAD